VEYCTSYSIKKNFPNSILYPFNVAEEFAVPWRVGAV